MMTDSTASAPEKASGPALEAKAMLAGLANDFRDFQTRIETRMKNQDDRIASLDRRATAARPVLSTGGADHALERKAVAAYLREGDDSGLRAAAIERKGLSTATPSEGGFLADPYTCGKIATMLSNKGVSLRCVANVVHVEAGVYETLVDRGEVGAVWAVETAVATETPTSSFEKIAIPLHELSALPRASQRLLEDSAFDVESWLIDRVVDRFGVAEAKAFISGAGGDEPRGLLSYPIVANTAWAWGSIGYVTTGVDGALDPNEPADALIDLIYSLDARYRANGAFVMNSRTASTIRKMKDADGRFLWTEPATADLPPQLLGHRVVICEHMPEIGSGTSPIAFGDFRSGYTVAERPEMRLLRDPYSAKPHVQFYVAARVGGAVTDFAAIKLLRFSVS